MPLKMPKITQQPVGEFALGNIPIPRYDKLGKVTGAAIAAAGGLIKTIKAEKLVGDVDEATGAAATELAELRAILVNQNTVDADWVGDDALGELQISTTKNGERDITTAVKIFTHEIADQVWKKRSQEIIDHYAGTISDREARSKFVGEMNERYGAPGTAAIAAANIVRSRAYSQARAERAIEGVLSSDAPSETRESNAREVIARQHLLGADPLWVERQLAAIGPAIDQMDVQNDILAASSMDQIDQVEERMWSGDNRMSPEQMRTMSAQMDARRLDFQKANVQRQTENADQMFGAYVEGQLTEKQVGLAVTGDRITHADGWQFLNGLQKGSTTKASDPFTLSRYQGAIQVIQYTGNQNQVLQRQKLLRLTISRAAMGLNPNGTPSGLPAAISGADAFKLNTELDKAVTAALENNEYDNALASLVMWTRVDVDLEGQIFAGIGGNQNTVNAALAFKQGLDAYMNQFGADAKPQEYFDANKDAFNPNNFAEGINKEFRDQIPQSDNFMTKAKGLGGFIFTEDDQGRFLRWFTTTGASTLEPAEYGRIWVLFKQYYRGQGIAPADGKLMLEGSDPLYHQFEALTQ